MSKTIEEKLKDFLGITRWEKFKKETQPNTTMKQDRDFLIEKYKSKFQRERPSTVKRVRL